MARSQFVLLLFLGFLIALGSGEIITLSELWTDLPCDKEITMSEATNDIQLRAQSIHITLVKCTDRNNASLDLITRVVRENTFYKITNPETGTWNCSFRSLIHARASYCTIHIKDLGDIASDKPFKVHEILAWFCVLAAVSSAVMVALAITVYYKKKVKRMETNEIPDHVRDRAPLELPSEITYDSVYSHRFCLNLNRHSREEQIYCNSKPIIHNIVNLDGNTFKSDYIPHRNLFV